MTTAYFAEVDSIKGTLYLGVKSKLSTVPFFFRSVSHLLRGLGGRQYFEDSEHYVPSRDDLKTVVVRVENIERGIRSSTATRFSVNDVKNFPKTERAIKMPSNAVFKIQLDAQAKYRQRFVGAGKYGKTWNRQGDVRSHITANMHRLKNAYFGASVLTIMMNPDGVTVSSVTQTPIVEFYRKSPFGNKSYLKTFCESMTGAIPTSLSPYA